MKNSFFGTIDKFFLGEIIFPFLPHVLGRAPDSLDVIKGSDLADIVDRKAAEAIATHPDPGSAGSLALANRLYQKGYIALESVGTLALLVFDRSLACRRYLTSRYSHIVVDEYQDSGTQQHLLFLRLHVAGLITVAVGDLNQSIFGFAGKSSRHLAELAGNPDFRAFALSKNHRCHPSISDYSLGLMSPSPSLAATNSEPRVFLRAQEGSEIDLAAFIDDVIPKFKSEFDLTDNASFAILVRGGRTAELVSGRIQTRHRYLKETPLDRQSSPWARLYKAILIFASNPTVTRFEILDDEFGIDAKSAEAQRILVLLGSIRRWVESGFDSAPIDEFRQVASTVLPGAASAAVMEALQETLADSTLVQSYAPALADEVQIMSLHKSKGLEFDVVFHMDLYDWILPGYEALKGDAEAFCQDLNLHYVGVTRARQACVLCTSSIRHRVARESGALEVVAAKASSFLTRHRLSGMRSLI